MKFLFAGTFGSDDPTRATFTFLQAKAAHEAGHEVQIALSGDAVVLFNPAVAENVQGNGVLFDFVSATFQGLLDNKLQELTKAGTASECPAGQDYFQLPTDIRCRDLVGSTRNHSSSSPNSSLQPFDTSLPQIVPRNARS